jgi:hypothetical protein
MILLLLRMSQLEQTLADMGISLGSGKLPPWLSLSLGLGALGLGIWSHRSRFAPAPPPRAMSAQEETPEPEPTEPERTVFETVTSNEPVMLEVSA